MKFLLPFFTRSNRRSTLRDLHAFGIIEVYRQDSIFRLWEPLRELRCLGDRPTEDTEHTN